MTRENKESPAPLAGDGGATCKGQPSIRSTERGESVGRSARLQRPTRPVQRGKGIDFDAINKAALASFPAVLARILPGGKRVGAEIVALNPRRADRRPGSFKVRFLGPRAGAWADFATGDRGGDVVSLWAYLEGVPQGEAARRLARMLGLEGGGRRDG